MDKRMVYPIVYVVLRTIPMLVGAGIHRFFQSRFLYNYQMAVVLSSAFGALFGWLLPLFLIAIWAPLRRRYPMLPVIPIVSIVMSIFGVLYRVTIATLFGSIIPLFTASIYMMIAFAIAILWLFLTVQERQNRRLRYAFLMQTALAVIFAIYYNPALNGVLFSLMFQADHIQLFTIINVSTNLLATFAGAWLIYELFRPEEIGECIESTTVDPVLEEEANQLAKDSSSLEY